MLLHFVTSISVSAKFCITSHVYLCIKEYVPAKKKVDGSENLILESIGHSLIRQEDSIIFSLLKRAQYCYNVDTYDPKAFSMDGSPGSLVEYMVRETENLHEKGYGGHMVECTKEMVESLENVVKCGVNEVEIREYLTNLTADIISRTEFGMSYEKGKQIFYLLTQLLYSGSLCLSNSPSLVSWKPDVNVSLSKKYPELYREGIRNVFFKWRVVAIWAFFSIY
ncbi:hypothetical protein RJT34_17267 [Clitoria ternatea]|uniref:chorismate mutase n=1 Tax=Clitoria ternatea TaxID=43366 RepID=A0AAN9PD26_CLITE